MSVINIAGCQMLVSADIDLNVSKIVAGIRDGAESGADLVVFPECAVSGYPPVHHTCISEIDVVAIAEANQTVCDAARKYGVWVVVGTIVQSSAGLLNTALLINDSGIIEGRQDKLHLFQGDKSYFVQGESLECFTIKGVRLGITVCYDSRFPEIYRVLREEGAEVFIMILNGCGGDTWKRPVMEGTFRCRAAENTAFVVAVNAAGPQQICVSRICDPLGVDLEVAEADTEQMLYAQLDTMKTQDGIYFDHRADLFNTSINHNL